MTQARNNEPENWMRQRGAGYQPGETFFRIATSCFRSILSLHRKNRAAGWRTERAGCPFHPLLNWRPIQFYAAVLCGLSALNLEAAEQTNNRPVAVWDVTARLSVGGGYRDNVLRTAVAPESSAFFITSADASFIRLSETGSQLTFYVLGEDTRYFDAPSLDYEQLFSGTAQATTPVGANDELGGQFSYFYQHQILDVSETEAALYRVLVDGHALTLRPYWKHTLRPGWAVQVEGTALRQLYGGELDDFWEAAGRLSLIHSYGRRSEVSLGYLSRHRLYDTREQFDSFGVIEPDTHLVYWQHELSGQWRHHWDKARRWRTTSKLSCLFNRDNGSGYFDYDRVLFSQQVRWADRGWEIRANVRGGWFFYQSQRIGDRHRERSYLALDLRVERKLSKHCLLYAAAEREWNWSNDPLDDYRDWAAGGGVGVEF